MNSFKENFKSAYKELYALHPNDPSNPNFRYVNQNWFFKNHLDIVIFNIDKFHGKYYPHTNREIALFGGLFHDAGLVFRRESASPDGHESRSEIYASIKLKELGYDEQFIDGVISCIRATEADAQAESEEAILVRSADAYSHFTSIHFFAKSNYSPSIEDFIVWFEKKIAGTYKKIEIAELKAEIEPVYNRYLGMIELYKKHQGLDVLEVVGEV